MSELICGLALKEETFWRLRYVLRFGRLFVHSESVVREGCCYSRREDMLVLDVAVQRDGLRAQRPSPQQGVHMHTVTKSRILFNLCVLGFVFLTTSVLECVCSQ